MCDAEKSSPIVLEGGVVVLFSSPSVQIFSLSCSSLSLLPKRGAGHLMGGRVPPPFAAFFLLPFSPFSERQTERER